ncbi:MAG TPA: hypothetical protein PK760_08940 [Flavobacteriales bacterium]|nr:hypothetical protein [Flavobacteriales bacterium]
MSNLKRLVGRRVASIEECYWRSEELTLLDYVTLTCVGGDTIVFRVGSTAEDVDLIDYAEFENELKEREPSMFSRSVVTDGLVWSRLIDNEILDVLVKDEKGYGHSSVVLFTSRGPTEVTTNAEDALEIILP